MARTTVIFPAYGHCPHLAASIKALLQDVVKPDEIIISHSGHGDPSKCLTALSGRVRVLHHPERLLAGAARNRGAAVATGEWLAFIDADVIPRPGWLRSLLARAMGEPESFAVGSVGYAVSGGYWGLCNWICEFSEQFPWHPARRQTGGASCSMLVRASDFRLAGGFPEDHQPGEDTLLFARLASMGLTQWFEPGGSVGHYNQSGLRSFLRHQYRLGRHSALVRLQVPLRGAIAAHFWPLGLLLWVPRLGLIGWRLVGGGLRWWVRGVALTPGLILGAWVWTAGFVGRARASREAG